MLAESDPQIAGEQSPSMSFVADEDGLVMARVDDRAPGFIPFSWVCVRAPGYGHQMEFRSLGNSIIRLPPQVEIPVEVRDWRDQPVADVLVSFCGGNGFTPDLETGRTDSNGRLTLTGVDLHSTIADFYLVHPELHYGYFSPDWYPGQGPLVLRADPAVVHRGVVVDEEGRPVIGAAVGISECQRGPWTRTGSDGSFRLCGLRQPKGLWVRFDGRRIQFPEDGIDALRLQLPPRDGDDAEGVQVVHLSPERREQRDAARRLRDQEQAASAAASPKVVVRAVGLPADGTVKLRTRRQVWDISEQVDLGVPVSLPSEEFVFWLEAEGCLRVVPADRSVALAAGLLDLHWYAPTKVVGHVLGEDGASLRAQIAFVETCESTPGDDEWRHVHGTFSLPTSLVGAQWMHVRHPGGSMRILPVNLPARGDDVSFDVGEVIVYAEPLYRFERCDGTPLVEGSVAVQRVGWTNTGPDSSQNWYFEPDDNGNFWLPKLLPGDALVVRSEFPGTPGLDGLEVYELPSRFLIGDQVPEVFRMHVGEIVVDVDVARPELHDPDIDPVATFDDQKTMLSVSGRSVVRGLKPKTYDVIVGLPWRRGVVVSFEVTAPGEDGGRRVLRVKLP